MNHVLIIGYVWVEPTSSAAGSRMLQLITFFKEYGYAVTFASPAQKGVNAVNLTDLEVNEVSITLNDSSFDSFITALNPSIVLFDRFMMEEQFGWRVAENCPSALRVLDTEDLHFLRKVRHQQLKKGESFSEKALLRSDEAKREVASILRCDFSLIISSFEMGLLQSVFSVNKERLLYLPFLLQKIGTDETSKWFSFQERKDFIFVGNFFHAPNVDTVLQLQRLWNRIHKKLPQAKLHIYGAYSTQQIKQIHKPEKGFFIHGYIKDIKGKVSRAKVVLAPLRFGAGIKGKLTEAMLCGTPSCTTKIGAEGMHDDLPWSGEIAENEDDFIDKAVMLYTTKNRWYETQQNGVVIINKIYDRDKLKKKFLNTIQDYEAYKEKYRRLNFIGNLLQHQTMKASKYMSKWIEEKNKHLPND